MEVPNDGMGKLKPTVGLHEPSTITDLYESSTAIDFRQPTPTIDALEMKTEKLEMDLIVFGNGTFNSSKQIGMLMVSTYMLRWKRS